MVLSADARILLTGDKTGRLRFWNPLAGRELWEKTLARVPIRVIALSPDNRWVAVGTDAPEILLVDRVRRRLAIPLCGHRSRPLSLSFSADSRRLLSGSTDNTAILWDTPT